MLPPKLTYLFTARFKDGTVIRQDRRDASQNHPLTRSAFYDVQQRLEEVASFSISDGENEHTVFLDDGHFLSNGSLIVSPHGELTNYRLIYFRRNHVTLEGGHSVVHVHRYFIGWHANDAKERHFEMKLEIDPKWSKRPSILNG